MAAPAALPPLPAAISAPSASSAPAPAPGGDASGNAFGQQLQAARHSQSGDASSPPAASKTPPSGADKQGNPSSKAPAKSAQDPHMATVGSTSATPAAGTASANASSKANAAANGQAADAALADAALAAMAQGTQDSAGTDDVAPKTSAPKTETSDDEGAASLAGAMLAMLGQVNGNLAGAQADADDGAVSADGSSQGHAKAAMLLQGQGTNGQVSAADGLPGATAGNAAPLADFSSLLNAAGGSSTTADNDTQKSSPGLDALAFATAPLAMPAANAQAVAPPQLQMSSPAGSAGFAGELGQQVVWLGQQGIQQAKIRLNPQDLGALDVHVSVNQSRIDVVFSAQHPAAVAAVQQSLPQLGNMLNRHGLSLGHAEVGQQGHGGHARGEGGNASASSGDEIGEVQGVALPVATTSRIGLLDAFA